MKAALFHLFIHQGCCCQQGQRENVRWLSVTITRWRNSKFLLILLCIVVNVIIPKCSAVQSIPQRRDYITALQRKG